MLAVWIPFGPGSIVPRWQAPRSLRPAVPLASSSRLPSPSA